MKQLASIRWLIVMLSALFLLGCEPAPSQQTELEAIKARGVLRVGTLNNQLSYYIGVDAPTGLDYELAKRFADKLGVRLEMKEEYNLTDLFQALEHGHYDLIAAGLTATPSRMEKFRAGPAYYFTNQQLVYRKGQKRPRRLKDLQKLEGIAITESSSHVETLEKLKEKYPKLEWQVVDDVDDNQLLQYIASGELMYTIADSVDVSLTQRLYPEVTVAMDLTEDEPVVWYLQEQRDDALYALVIEFFGELNQSGELAKLEEKYFGHVNRFDYFDTRAFFTAVDNRLPKWQPLFEKYATDFDWRLLAAVAYQESHWKPNAVSPTGVRGMMMLTMPTAKSVGVTDRRDPEQSIRGGAIYLKRVLDRVPDSIEEDEKIWFALASYNVGFGHMMDARRLTQKYGGDPNSWSDVKQFLPLLRNPKYHRQTRYGFARGDEAQHYVENIRRYYQSLVGYHKKQEIQQINGGTETNLDDLEQLGQPDKDKESGGKNSAKKR
ncbi:Membrane-bound lytic murein transglycosylase F [Vibrio stylophorae]|uniref:Membrane-bound lytic murein transglycosylase F n=1 Tax=Vibrio stylophorae TaxID=659351 RepID=A0ABN8DNV6_9VIBR|nr:membrane-bound lytic murein transglycosylase MltF [Vibrio stylophorae]CAH0532884.1 Membrane-bound lytic murein transglycosylase F [Vibrio stylophorae]